MNTESRSLRQQRAKLINEMYDLTSKTDFPAEAQKRWKEIDGQQKALETRIATVESEELNAEMQRVVDPAFDVRNHRRASTNDGSTPIRAEDAFMRPPQEGFGESRTTRMQTGPIATAEYRDAFNVFLRRGENSLKTSERSILIDADREVRTYSGLNTGVSGDAGGFMVPIGFQRELEKRMKAYGRMRAACRILNTSTGNPLNWPAMDDTSQSGEFLNEQAPVSQVNPSFSNIAFSSFLASSKQVKLSVQLLQDSAFDVESVLADAFAIRIGRIVNAKYTNGSGSGEPEGLVYAIQNDAVPNIVNAKGANSNSGDSGDTEANSVGSDDLENLVEAVDPLYRAGGSFMMHYKTIDKLRRLKDKYGRPLWQASLAADTPDKIFGFPFDWNVDMDQVAAGKYSVLFGDFSKHVIRDCGGLTLMRYNELYMVTHEVGFQSWLRTDSRRLQQSAFSLLYNPLS